MRAVALELALRAAGQSFPRLSATSYRDVPPPHSWRVDTETEGHGYFALDVTLTPQGDIHLIEANGSFASFTGCIDGRYDDRARHMVEAFKAKRASSGPVAVLLPHTDSLGNTIADCFYRIGAFADLLAHTEDAMLRSPDEELGPERVAIVCGGVSDIASKVAILTGRLTYQRRPVAFATNPNLLIELVRRRQLRQDGDRYLVDTSVFHESHCAGLVHDKCVQQQLATGTGFVPLRWARAFSRDECVKVLGAFRADGMAAIVKMRAGSGSAGIAVLGPVHGQDVVASRLDELFETAERKYGPAVRETMFPLEVFQFVRSTPFEMEGREHLWYMRVECLINTGYVDVKPCIIRVCPEPFDDKTYHRAGVISTLRGRTDAIRFMLSPVALLKDRNLSVLDTVRVNPEVHKRLIQSCAKWCQNAWQPRAPG
ncbi:MAG: hypothetical protein ACKVPX_14630 [Myxococcaceae bacterium]